MALAGAVVDTYNTQRKNITRDVAIMLSPSELQMDEEDILRSLHDDGFNRRSEVLEKIRKNVRITNVLQFSDKLSFFRALNRALSDGNWDVRHQCILLLTEIVPLLGTGVDECMSVVLVKLISCIGDSKITVRRVVIQALHTYMRHTSSIGQFLRSIVSLGLENVDSKVRKEVVVSLPMLLTAEFANENFAEVISSLCHKLDGGMSPEEAGTQKVTLVTLDRLRDLIGEARFRGQLASCAPLARDCYCRAVAVDFKAGDSAAGAKNPVPASAEEASPAAATHSDSELELGVLPAGLLAQLNADRDDFRARAQAAERLKEVLEKLPKGSASAAAQHLGALLAVVGNLLDDANFRVVTLALDALAILIDRVGREARPHVRSIVAALTRRMGDNKTVVRASVARAALQLMQSLGPQVVLAVLSENTGHRNSRVRAETLNLVIAALLTFPSCDVDLPSACSNAACCLADARRAVRHAALECAAVLAQCLGPARSAPLARAVEAVELHYDGAGVAAAVAARLSRRVLPRRDADGLIEYALQLPSGTASKTAGGSATSSAMPPGADIDWVMAGSGAGGGGGSSARSIRLEDLEASTPSDAVASSPGKRQPAASGGAAKPSARNKLPWGDGGNADSGGGPVYGSAPALQTSKDTANGIGRSFQSPATTPRQTWTEYGGQSLPADTNGSAPKKVVRKHSSGTTTASNVSGSGGTVSSFPQEHSAGMDGYAADGDSGNVESSATARSALPPSSSSVSAHTVARPAFSKAPPKAGLLATGSNGNPAGLMGSGKPPPDIRGDLSSSWPGIKRIPAAAAAPGSDDNGSGMLGRRPILDPISAPDTPLPSQQPSPAWVGEADERRGRNGRDVDDAPVHVKPQLVRSASRGRAGGVAAVSVGAKMPPIQLPERSNSPRRDGIAGADDNDSAYGTIDMDDGGGSGGVQDGLMSSLNKIRHSASKKKAEKLFRKLELKQSVSGGSGQDDVTPVLSAASSPEPAIGLSPSTTRANPFEAKAKLVRRASHPVKTSGSPAEDSGGGSPATVTTRSDVVKPEYNPLAGVTFRRGGEQADVSVVGRGYGDDTNVADSRPAVLAAGKGQREKRRSGVAAVAAAGGKGPRLSPLALTSVPTNGSMSQEDERVSIVGHGMFDGGPHGGVDQQMATSKTLAAAASSFRGTDPGFIPVHSVTAALRPAGAAQLSELESAEEPSGEEVQLAPALRGQMAARRKEKAEEAAMLRRRRQLEQEQEERLAAAVAEQEQATERRQREQAAEKRRRISERKYADDSAAAASAGDAAALENGFGEDGGTSLVVAGTSPSKTADSKPPTGRRLQQPPSRRRTASPAGAPGSQSQFAAGNGSGAEQLVPLTDPDAALRDAFCLLADDDWNSKYNGIMMVRRLVAFHDDVLAEQAHAVTVALVKEVQNLRSQVARLAIVALGDLFGRLKRTMDSELDAAAKALLHKNGESNEFIRAELEKSLRVMVEETTPQRALTAVINGGASHKNQAVRRVVAQLLDALTEKLGPDRLLAGVKDSTDRLLPVLAQLVADPSPETRWYARKTVMTLMDHQDWEKVVGKFLPTASQRTIKDACDGLRSKGLGDMPTDTPSAKGRRSGIVSRSRTSSSDSIPLLGSDATPSSAGLGGPKAMSIAATPPVVRKALFRVGDDELVKQLCATLTANDWQQRYDGITELADMCDSNPDLVANHIVRIFDKFIPLLKDSNSKVNLYALQTLTSRMLRPLASNMGQVTSLTVQTAAANLASKNREVCAAANELLDAFIEHLDNSQLMQPFANQALVCTAKVKPVLIDRVSLLAERVYPRKPKHVVLHVLPLLWHLLGVAGSGASAVRASATELIAVLHRLMGGALVDEAAGNSLVSAASVRLLRDLIEESAASEEGRPERSVTSSRIT